MRRVLALSILFYLAGAASAQSPKGLYCPEANWDWGEVGIDFDLAHTYLLVNHSSSRVFIDSVIAPCDCSLARPSDSSLKPGDTARVLLKFSTRDFYGRTTKQVDVYWRDSTRHYLQLTYSATVGQYFGALKPDPISVFIIPGQPPRKIFIPVPKNDYYSEAEIVGDIVQHTDIVDIKVLKPKASIGDKLEIEVAPHADLKTGTYFSNFRFQIQVVIKGQPQGLLITIPTKIVRY